MLHHPITQPVAVGLEASSAMADALQSSVRHQTSLRTANAANRGSCEPKGISPRTDDQRSRVQRRSPPRFILPPEAKPDVAARNLSGAVTQGTRAPANVAAPARTKASTSYNLLKHGHLPVLWSQRPRPAVATIRFRFR